MRSPAGGRKECVISPRFASQVDPPKYPMQVSKSSWSVKLERAREHILQFTESAAVCLHVRPEDMMLEGDINIGDGPFVTQSVIITSRPVPERLGAIAGDAFHNIRSALDHIAVALTHDERAAFVVTSAPSESRLRDIEKFLAAVPEAAGKLIRGAQPYQNESPESHPLAILQRFDNLDKHRALVLVAAFFRTESAEPHDSPDAYVHAVRLGSGIGGAGLQELFSLDITIPQGSSLSVAFTIRGELTFAADGPVPGIGVVPTLEKVFQFTSRLISDLEHFVV
jgi:hypothetical protein